MTEALLVEIKEFNKILQMQAEMLGEKEYEYVYLDRYNPDNYTDHYYPVIGKVYDKTKFSGIFCEKSIKNIFWL